MQGIGFIIAGLSPWLSGLLRSLSGNYTLDWSWHAICVLLLMALTLRFIPAHYPAEWRQRASDLPEPTAARGKDNAARSRWPSPAPSLKPVSFASLALNLLPCEINVSPNHDTRK
jgi:CP family cyanate transporter-like MFS transporter